MTKPIGWFSKQAHLSEHYLVFLARPMPTRDRFLYPVFLSLTFAQTMLSLSTVLFGLSDDLWGCASGCNPTVYRSHDCLEVSSGWTFGTWWRYPTFALFRVLSFPIKLSSKYFFSTRRLPWHASPCHSSCIKDPSKPTPSSLGIHPKGFMPHVSAHNGRTFNFGRELLPSIPSYLFGSFSLKISLVILDSPLLQWVKLLLWHGLRALGLLLFFQTNTPSAVLLWAKPLWWSKTAGGQGCPLWPEGPLGCASQWLLAAHSKRPSGGATRLDPQDGA